MRIIPVMDVMGGRVVHGIGGWRSEYQPLVSELCPSSDPLELADSFHARFGLSELYVADLDAIGGAEPALPLFAHLRACGFRLWVDAGVRTAEDALRLAEAGIEYVVVGLETVRGPKEMHKIVENLGARVAFSLDLKNGQILGDAAAWGTQDAEAVADQVIAMGIHKLIVLDLARVGVGIGVGTESLIAKLWKHYPHIELIAGGGVRDAEDLMRLEQCGVSAALVASALHDGRLP